MAETLKKLQDLKALPSGLHWFCSKYDATPESPRVKTEHPIAQSVELRQEQAGDCLRLFAYDGVEALPYQEALAEGINIQLSRCDLCVIGYYKSRQKLIEHLRNEYDEEEVAELLRVISIRDIERIKHGLDVAARKLRRTDPPGRHKDVLGLTSQLALFEALCCQAFLEDEALLAQHFQEPFKMVQTNRTLKITHYVPAATIFLFDTNQDRRNWATYNWLRYQSVPTEEDFNFAIRDSLLQNMQSVAGVVTESKFLQRLWYGIGLIVDKLDNNLVTHSLRAMDVDVFRLALEHLKYDTQGFRSLVQAIKKLLELAPTDFWDSMGAISPTIFIEQVFNNPQYDSFVRDANENENSDSSALHDMVSWIKPFMASLETAHQARACRSLDFQLLHRLQGERFPLYARLECKHVGLDTLAWTLENCNNQTAAISDDTRGNCTLSHTGRIVAAEALEVTSEYIEDVINIPNLPAEDDAQVSCAETCLKIIKHALKLECKSLRTDQEALKHDQELPNGFESYSPAIWDAVVQHLDRGNVKVARAALVGVNDLTGLEKFKVNADETNAKEKSSFNVKLGRLTHLVCQILERINDFDPDDLDRLFKYSDTATALVASLFSSDTNLYEAGVNLIKSSSYESARRDAIGYHLKTSFVTTLNAVSWSLKRIGNNRTFASCPRMLKTSADVLDVLCNSQNGLLRIQNLSGDDTAKALEMFWQHQWESLGVIYDLTETWSRAKAADTQIFKHFCRDTMQLSEHLFDQYSVFASAIYSAVPIKLEESNIKAQNNQVGRELVRHPAKIMEAMAKWLRLRDEYLMETSVKLTKKVLGRLTELGMVVAQGPCKFLELVLTNGPSAKTNISPQEKAEIARALEANLGRPILPAVDTDQDQSDTLSDRSRKPSVIAKKNSKIGTIDLDTWRSNAKSSPRLVEVSDDDSGDSDTDHRMLSANRSAELMKDMNTSIPARNAPLQARDHKASALPTREQKSVKPNKPSKPSGLSDADRALFRENREREREAKKRQDAAAIAFHKKKATIGSVGQTHGEGSGLGNIGVKGKDHTPKTTSMMVSSGSESESDDIDELFGTDPKPSKASKVYQDFSVTKIMQSKVKGPIKKTRQIRSAKDMRARLAPDLTALHTTILGWDFFHNGDFPPGSERNDYSLVSNAFRTPSDYQFTFEPLLILEAWQGFLKSKEEGGFKVFEIKVANRMTVDAFLEVSTTMPMTEGKEQGISEADVILMSKSQSPADEAQSPHCLARVHKISRKKGIMEVTYRANAGNSLVASMIPSSTLYAVKISSLTPLEREYGALLGLKYFDLCDEIIKARPSPLLEYSAKQLGPLVTKYSINTAQAKAVRSAIDNDAFTLIQGPPGSGKTKTIVAIVGALLTGQFGEKGVHIPRPQVSQVIAQRPGNISAAKKLLVCAPSNAAVDELVMRFKKGIKTIDGSVQKLSVIRLGRSDAINANVRDVTLEELVNAKLNLAVGKKSGEGDEVHKIMMKHKEACDEFNTLRTKVDEAKAKGKPVLPEQEREFEVLRRKKQQLSNRIDAAKDSGDTMARDADLRRRHVQQELLNDAHVICATLSGSGHEMFQNLKIEFETVIIDEAAQSIELSALIPLKYGCSKCILVGDPKQLPPTVLSREAARFQYEQSLFVRMQANHPNDVHLLDTQYRMHPEISVFPSNAFYDGRLLDGAGMAKLRERPWHQSNIMGPYRFFDVQGAHQSAPQGHSLVNYAEIEVAISLFDRLITDCKGYDFKGKVGIITPYKSQLRQLRFRFAQKYSESVLTSVEFNTTDAFQGRESEVIIFSCVRASVNKGIGFLSDIRRMNVGITRAKSSLWVLGNSQSLMRGDFWAKLIQDARSRDRYTGGDLLGLLKRPLLQLDPRLLSTPKTSAPVAASTRNSNDVDMPDAPVAASSTDTGQSRAAPPSPVDITMADDAGAVSYNPSGGSNGLNPRACCLKCGSFEHYTHFCKETKVQGDCYRCGANGHRKFACPNKRCMACGEFGHLEQTCTNETILSSKEKSRIVGQEEEHRREMQNLTETRRRSQLGGHDVQIPVIRSTPDSPPHGNASKNVPQSKTGDKRKRNPSSPTVAAPKGPKLMHGSSRPSQQVSRPTSKGNGQALPTMPNGSSDSSRNESLGYNARAPRPASDIPGLPQPAYSADMGRVHESTRKMDGGARSDLETSFQPSSSVPPRPPQPTIGPDKATPKDRPRSETTHRPSEDYHGNPEARPAITYRPMETCNAAVGVARDLGLPGQAESSTSQSDRQGDGLGANPTTKPRPPPKNTIRPPRRKKEVDPFIRPRKRP